MRGFEWVNNFFKSKKHTMVPKEHKTNSTHAGINKEIYSSTDYIFNKMNELGTLHNLPILLYVDAPREYIYQGNAPKASPDYRLNIMASDLAKKNNIELLDLTNNFASRFEAEKKKFNFHIDNHWNQHGHSVVGTSLAKKLGQLGCIKSLQ